MTGATVAETLSERIASVEPTSLPPVVRGFAEHLVLDMSGVSFMDSAGIGALVSLFVHRRNAGKSFAIAGLTQQGNAVLQVAGLTKLLPNFPTVEAALVAKT